MAFIAFPLGVLVYLQQWWLAAGLLALLSLVLFILLKRSSDNLSRSNIQLTDERNRYQVLFDNAPEAYFILSSKDGSIIKCNRGAERMLGATQEALIGKLPFELSPAMQPTGESSKQAAKEMTRRIIAAGEYTFEWVHQSVDGNALWVEVEIRRGVYDGETVYFSTWRSIARRKELESELVKLANEDPLTGLLNRYSLQQSVERQLASAKRHESMLTLFFIDLDRFKYINDSYGHKLGDQLLVEVADRLRASVRSEDLVARLSGDEFVLVFSDKMTVFEMEQLAKKVSAQFDRPIQAGPHSIGMSVSLGIASYPQDANNFDSLLRAADTALYQAKALGRGQHHFFSEKLADMASEHLRVEQGLRRALDLQEFELVYQKQISVVDETIAGIEALLRWNDPQHGLVFPQEFLQVAADTNQLEPLEYWIIESALFQAKQWYDQGHHFGRLAVNLSAQSLQRGYAADAFKQAIKRTGCPTFLIEAEISENFLMDNSEVGLEQLTKIRALGIELALDDFGTGFSSLRHLKLLPINTLKIDKSFIEDMRSSGPGLDIVSATIAMAHKLALKVVAEGVEQPYQFDLLKREHCDVIQGFLFSKPVSAHQVFNEHSPQSQPS